MQLIKCVMQCKMCSTQCSQGGKMPNWTHFQIYIIGAKHLLIDFFFQK